MIEDGIELYSLTLERKVYSMTAINDTCLLLYAYEQLKVIDLFTFIQVYEKRIEFKI
jgi:hypothetical protein